MHSPKFNSYEWHLWREILGNICLCKCILHPQNQIYCLLYMCAQSLSHVWLCDSMDYSLPYSSDHGTLQVRILEWVANILSRGSSWPRDWTRVYCTSPALQVDSLPLSQRGSLPALLDIYSHLMNLMNDQMPSSDRVQPMLEVNCRNIMKRSYKQR